MHIVHYEVCQAVDSMTRVIKCNSGQRNKFTEGLDFASIVDWTSELRPSMKKLRQAMDGLLKTARLTHSVFRVQEDPKAAQRACNVRYRRDVCFSQAVSLQHIFFYFNIIVPFSLLFFILDFIVLIIIFCDFS